MIPDTPIKHDMRFAGTPRGDCWRCCVAGILGLPYEEVPDFINERNPASDVGWLLDCGRWLAERNVVLVVLGAVNFEGYDATGHAETLGYTILCGYTDRSTEKHATIGKWGQVWHDPHPDREGLGQITECYWLAEVDPAKVDRS